MSEEWPDHLIAKLRELHAQENPRLSMREIGRILHKGKDSICGKCDRIGLSRPNPVGQNKGTGKPKPIGRPKTGGPTLPVLDSLPVLEVPLVKRLRSPCCWPMETCLEPSELGRPYCHAHSAAAYVQTGRQLISCEAVA
jgi:hypothetical protein